MCTSIMILISCLPFTITTTSFEYTVMECQCKPLFIFCMRTSFTKSNKFIGNRTIWIRIIESTLLYTTTSKTASYPSTNKITKEFIVLITFGNALNVLTYVWRSLKKIAIRLICDMNKCGFWSRLHLTVLASFVLKNLEAIQLLLTITQWK